LVLLGLVARLFVFVEITVEIEHSLFSLGVHTERLGHQGGGIGFGILSAQGSKVNGVGLVLKALHPGWKVTGIGRTGLPEGTFYGAEIDGRIFDLGFGACWKRSTSRGRRVGIS